MIHTESVQKLIDKEGQEAASQRSESTVDLHGHGTAVWVAEGRPKKVAHGCSAPGKIVRPGTHPVDTAILHATLSTPIAMFGKMQN